MIYPYAVLAAVPVFVKDDVFTWFPIAVHIAEVCFMASKLLNIFEKPTVRFVFRHKKTVFNKTALRLLLSGFQK